MPNWCNTTYKIQGPEKEIKVLNDAFLEAQKKAHVKTDFGKEWLGHIVTFLGEDWEHVSCRGAITYLEADGDELTIDTETAWGPMHEPIRMMCDKYAPESDVCYTSEEPGMGFYETNDPEIAGEYLVQVYEDAPLPLGEVDYETFSKEELKDLLEETLKKKDGLLSLIQEACDYYEVNISRYEYSEWR